MAPPPAAPIGQLLEEGTGESSSPPRSSAAHDELRRKIYERLVQAGKQGDSDDASFRNMLDAHFDKLPPRYLTDLSESKAEDVLLHREVLDECAHNGNQPVFRARFLKCMVVQPEWVDTSPDSETYQRLLEDLTLERIHGTDTTGSMSSPSRDSEPALLHEIIFSSLDKPKLLSRLTALLSEVGLNIQEAHVYSTTDGFCLDVFVVDGWKTEETEALIATIEDTLMRKNGAPPNSANASSSEKILELREQLVDCEIDWNILAVAEKITSGSSADLYRGTHSGLDVCIKILRSAHHNSPSEVEFLQQALMLRRVKHENILTFYGACTKHRKYCAIVTEYMPGGDLYEFVHKQNDVLDLLLILRIAMSISKGMECLHQHNIIHRDLKTANILMGDNHVVKIADFGVARVGSQEGQMTAETGTYRWMAPEVPYDNMTPLQAALGVRQGLRLEIPAGVHPGLSKLIEQCWDEDPDIRPVFAEIIVQLEDILQEIQVPKGGHRRSRAKMQKKSPR
ncbi:serine/threonine-protein kinase STY46 isoform X2 [Aegilops tauschii subsp. strangulata]|uniref:serine/threonine-protein kinase STY46 isoform X2 n=1 Tax=Aegilops tauschii subsp. strangulata TaxID=200361 RepID=UPI00098AEBEA|nr:serine/threonine-protein kinase STY46 isoform X2 [Aegilops tauschii subsp. strangulata]